MDVSGRCWARAAEITEEAGLRDVHPEQLRDLVDDDHEPDAGLEAREHRVGDEVGDKPQSEHRRENEQDADQHGERCRRGDE